MAFVSLRSVFILLLGIALEASAVPKYDASILRLLEENSAAPVLLHFHDSHVASIIEYYNQRYDSAQRLNDYKTLPSLLKAHAAESQAEVLELLKSAQEATSTPSLRYNQIWIVNQLSIKNMNTDLFTKLLEIPTISYIEEDKLHTNALPTTSSNASLRITRAGTTANAWGVDDIEAPAVWSTGNIGSDVVIGIIDTGVRQTHEALRDGWRQSYGWFDAVNGQTTPYDDNGHGTHCIGSAVGRNGIGVAPGAQYISCKALNAQNSFFGSEVLLCGQWMFCPTDANGGNEDCSKRPKIVTNSWIYNSNGNAYDNILSSWESAGMIYVFCNGNRGQQGCSSVQSPADSPMAIGVGATNDGNQVTTFSARGPSPSLLMKPDVSAPGESVYSAGNTADNEYTYKSGTSMATPHVAGLAALIVSANPSVTQSQVRSMLQQGTRPTLSTGQSCDGIPDSAYPNNHVGFGKIHAPSAVGVQ